MPTVPDADLPRPAPPPEDADLQTWAAFHLAVQAPACRVLGSQLYAVLLEAAAEDVRAGGPAWAVLEPHATRDTGAALALRFMAAVHRLVLSRQAPELALFFPSVGGQGDPGDAWPPLRRVLVAHRTALTEWIGLPCQTNEVGRCAALVGGFLTAAAESRLPLRLFEIGASAGLNLRWDRYRYADDDDGRAWGDPESPVQWRGHWDVPVPLLGTQARIAGRAGCDPLPIDPLTEEGRLRLSASVWGDQPARFERLRGALRVAAALRVPVVSASAINWLPAQLSMSRNGEAVVVYHSVVLQYLDPAERDDVVATIQGAGDRATPERPLYWLRMEPERPLRAMSVRLTRWPGGEERLLATAGAHGNPVRWRTGDNSG
jgi:hypothetical protein